MQVTTQATTVARASGSADDRLHDFLDTARPLLGPVWFAFAFLTLAALLPKPINPYDEGIVLTHSGLVLAGRVPYRDFYTNYPPGIFFLVAGLWKLTGVSVLAARVLGLSIQVLLALGTGRLAGRIAGRNWGWLSAGLVLTLLTHVGPTPRAWLAALALAFVACELLLLASERGGLRWPAAGIALGAVGCFRHELFIYMVLALVPAALLWRPCGGRLPSARACAALVLGAALPLALMWIPTLRAAPWEHVYGDLYREMVEHVMPARTLPVSGLFGRWELWAVLSAPVLALVALCSQPRSPSVLLAGLLSVVVLPAATVRASDTHVVYAIAPAVVILPTIGTLLLVRWLGERRGRNAGLLLMVALVALNWHTPWPKHEHDFEWVAHGERGLVPKRSIARDNRDDVLQFIEERTSPGEAIFVGDREHRFVHCNQMDLYFLAERPPATRWIQFDPGLITRDEIQARMIDDFERNDLRVAVLLECDSEPEPNLSAIPGSSRLDEYLDAHFEVVDEVGGYTLLERRPR